MNRLRLKINKTNFVRMLWERGFRTSARAARFFTVSAEKSASRRLEWFLVWKSPLGDFEARIFRANREIPMLWVKRQGVILRAEPLPTGTLKMYEMVKQWGIEPR